jgi:hypothetical protein
MIIVYGGDWFDEPATAALRASGRPKPDLGTRLRGLFRSLEPSDLVGGLATNADFAFACAALAEGCTVHAVLPAARDEFRDAMIAEHGDPWGVSFDRILSQVRVVEAGGDTGTGQHNVRLLDEGMSLAGTDGRVWVMTVRREPGSGPTDDLVFRAGDRELLTLDFKPEQEQDRAFILMPYGLKRDGESGTDVDCDPPFHKVYRPLLEDADLDWSRADLDTGSGIIHPSMLEELANCEVAIADLTTMNFNVAYELGVRHVFAPWSTVLVSPQVAELGRRRPPFDIQMSRIHKFARGLTLTDAEAEAAIRQLQPVVAQAVKNATADSPAHQWFEVDHIRGPYHLRHEVKQKEAAAVAARERVADALRSSDRAVMTAAVSSLDGAADIAEPVRRALRIELGWALLNESAYREALEQFILSEPPDHDQLHQIWLQRTVMAYRRLGEHEDDPQLRMDHVMNAQRLLAKAEAAGYRDSETYGIWGGLIKREIQEAGRPLADPLTQARFADMADKYRLGFHLDPAYYPGVNLVMALRLGARDQDRFAEEFPETVIVTRFLARRALETDPRDIWASFTMAELALHEALENDAEDLTEPIRLYGAAALHAGPDSLESAIFQLEFLRTFGDHPDAVGQVQDALVQFRDLRKSQAAS